MKTWRTVFSLVPDVHARLGHYQTLWQRHFYEGLAGAVSRLITPRDISFAWIQRGPEPDPDAISGSRAETAQRLWEQIREAHQRFGLDAVLTYCFASDLEASLVQETIKLGVPWVNFYCDSLHRFSEIAALARVVTLNWFPEHAARGRYQAEGGSVFCRPFAVNPVYLPDLSCQKPRYPVGFIGVPSHNRITQLGWLRLRGCRVEIRGHGWTEPQANPFYSARPFLGRLWEALRHPHLGEKVARRIFWPLVRSQAGGGLNETEFPGFVAECQVLLGLTQAVDDHGQRSSSLRFRDIEFPGYGCCYLTEQNEDLAEALDPGKDVLTYRSLGEAAHQVRRITRHPEEAHRIGHAGRQRVLAEHTWSARVNELQAHLS